MRVLACHNFYQQPGGEDHSFADEVELLESRGHEVVQFTLHNDSIKGMSGQQVATKTLWNSKSYDELRRLIRRSKPAVMHCTNTFPLISPAAYYAARAERVPVVQALRNYRLLCANAFFMRAGRVCEDCLTTRTNWPAVAHRCYRDSVGASATVATMLAGHRLAGTWRRMVDVYYALTDFARQKFIEGGLPAERIAVKPNFVSGNPAPGSGAGGYALFVGRLAPEKGIETLLSAWAGHREPIVLKIAGDGELAPQVRAAAATDPRIELLGWQDQQAICELVGEAACIVMPSLWYEGFPRTIADAYARGTPVLASRLGAMAELVRDGVTGQRFNPGDADDLARTVVETWRDGILQRMRPAARQEFETYYTADINYRTLMLIYEQALDRGSAGEPSERNRSSLRVSRPTNAWERP